VRRYRELLRVPGVGRLTAAVLFGRVATSMLNLALLVAVTQRHGYASAGLLLMLFAVVNAIAGPVRGRQADRRGPRRVLLWLVAAHAVAWVALLTALLTDAPVTVLCLTAAGLGATIPPAGPAVRGLWPTLIPGDQLTTAYAFDAALNTATFIAGPMIAGGLLLAMPAQAVVVVTGVVKLAGDLLVALSPPLRALRGKPRDGGFFGPLGQPRVRLLLAMIAVDTFAFGCLEVAAVATTSGSGTAGFFTSALSVGAVVSGIGYGARTWPGGPRAQLATLHLGGAAVLAAAGLTGAAVAVLVAYTAYGLVNGPVETLQQLLVGDLTPDGQRIEAFAWVFSVMWAGFGIGTTVAGRLVGDGRAAGALHAATAAQAVAALIALRLGRRRPA
jgi:MFS transporter